MVRLKILKEDCMGRIEDTERDSFESELDSKDQQTMDKIMANT